MQKATMTFGAIAAAIIIVYTSIILVAFGDFSTMSLQQFKIVELLGYVRYLILFLTILYVMRTYRKQTDQPVSYWNIVKQGLQVVFIIAVCIGIMEVVYFLANPDFFDKYGTMYMKQLVSGGATPDVIHRAQQEINNEKWLQNPVMMGIFYFVETALIGGVLSLLIGYFFKTRKAVIA